MPVANRTVARNEMLTVVRDAWIAGGEDPAQLRYWDVKENPPGASSWARVTVQQATGEQATLSNDDGARKFSRGGIITVQIFTPFGGGLTEADALAKIVEDAFEGQTTPSGIWFRNVRVNEIGQDGDRFQTNVLIDYTYDEIK